MNIAEIILEQLGGNRFLIMTGAKNLVNTGNGLAFSLPANFAKEKINHVHIALTKEDLYDVTYSNRRGINFKEITKSEAIYCDMLEADFTETTGLSLRI
ncbi:TPA: hypothetical protein R4328_001440 [Pasteurella multocida]|uniref:hypothetical protein n=1 Tax=Pasteurella multocida TaxID=747 RepID=UPI0007ED237B|nr:hypothetical protein [Pasteurella multocida]AWY03317.1 hypothetical protein [Pasteurella phage Pm86]MCL7822614.1 hypothetical protein [Pasteurella multocida]OBP35902.1 hypothetical protein A0R74_02515 [Pasteurella multocida subsp. multocida]URH77982.1 hypothetical protein M8848_10055 [Pasteurella multocida]URH97340.1 hypothetical protein M8854_05330 [Pasteurella multocida]